MNFKFAVDCKAQLPETPTWDERIRKLYWTDMDKGDVHAFDPADGSDTLWHIGRMVGSAIPCDDMEKLLVILDNGAFLMALKDGSLRFIADPAGGDESLRYSDCRVDAAGRIYMSTVAKTYGSDAYTPDQTGALYSVERDGSVRVIEPAINQYNTILWNGDSTLMYAADTYNETLVAYDYDLEKGVISPARTALDFKGGLGMPDGMSMDEDDNLYICHWSGQISVWDRFLRPLAPIAFPTPQVTCGGFGGEDMRDFYVGAGAWNYGEDELKAHPGSGGMFVGRSDIPGRAYHMYKTRA